MPNTIEELEAAYNEAVLTLHLTKSALLEARRAALPFREGEVVEALYYDYRTGTPAWEPTILRRIEVRTSGTSATYYGAKRTKSGAWSRVTQYLGDSENVRKAGA